MSWGKRYILIIVGALSLILMPEAANASYTQLYCNADGSIGMDGSGHESQLFHGDPYQHTGACQYTGLDHIFSTVICQFVYILNNILGRIYCGIQHEMTSVLTIALTLYIAVFGAQILMGATRLKAGDMVVHMLKIALIWMFVTQSVWGIGIAFQFFVGIATEGSKWVLNPILGMNTGGDVMPIYEYIDRMIYCAILGPLTNTLTNVTSGCSAAFGNGGSVGSTLNYKLIGFFLVSWYTVPIVGAMGVYWLWSTMVMLARTLITFMLGISAIAFLIALSPIFLSFMLFRSTNYFFQNWLRHLMSYSLQIVVTFAIVAMWINMTGYFIGFFDNLSNMIFPVNRIQVAAPTMFQPTDTWGICPAYYSNVYMPDARCKCPDSTLNVPASLYNTAYSGCQGSFGREDLIPPSKLYQAGLFLYYVIYNLTVLLILAYAFSTLLNEAPDIARNLAGPAYIPPLMGGWGNVSWDSIRGQQEKFSWFRQRHDTGSGGGSGGGMSSLFSHAGKAVGNVVGSVHQKVSNRPKVGG